MGKCFFLSKLVKSVFARFFLFVFIACIIFTTQGYTQTQKKYCITWNVICSAGGTWEDQSPAGVKWYSESTLDAIWEGYAEIEGFLDEYGFYDFEVTSLSHNGESHFWVYFKETYKINCGGEWGYVYNYMDTTENAGAEYIDQEDFKHRLIQWAHHVESQDNGTMEDPFKGGGYPFL